MPAPTISAVHANDPSPKGRVRSSRGLTLVELLMSFTILSIGVLGFIGAFLAVSKSIHISKSRAVANNLLQEKIEAMKNISYYRLIATTAPLSASEFGITTFQYDNGYYPPETMTIGDVQYTRRVFVEKVSASGGGTPTSLSYQTPDSGLKRIKAYVLWRDAGKWRSQEMQNLVNNPNRSMLNGLVAGTLNVTSGQQSGAVVMVTQNAAWFDDATAAGSYSFSVAAGTYTLQASKAGYFPQTVENAYVGESSTYTWNPTLTRMSSGSVTGTAYIRDHVVISQVVGSTIHAATGWDQEYVELHNPTTSTVIMAVYSALPFPSTSPVLDFYNDPEGSGGGDDPYVAPLVYNTLSIPPSGYYLIANTDTIRAGNVTRVVDAVFDPSATGYPNLIEVMEDAGGQASGGVGLAAAGAGSWATAAWVDRMGWNRTGQVPQLRETTAVNQANGLERMEQIIRRSRPSSLSGSEGRAYDSNVNNSDIFLLNPVIYPPMNSTITQNPITGTPAAGCFASANDGLSETATCGTDGAFTIYAVSTGTWTVNISSGGKFNQVTAPAVTFDGNVVSAGTTIALTSTTDQGTITGVVRAAQSNALLSGITVQSGSGNVGVTGASGRYSISMSTGLTSVTANPGNMSTSYVSETVNGVTVDAGVYTSGVDFTLDTGGRVRGYIIIGANPLPGVPVIASTGSVTGAAETATDSSGYFTLTNLSTGSYVIQPQLESGETVSPSSVTVNLAAAGETVFSATFTVTSAFGYITGSLTAGGQPLKTGVLIFASTGTLSTTYPPNIDSAVRNSTTKYYAGSSLTDGTYEIYVPGGNPGTPVTYNVYGWYTTWNGQTAMVARRNTTAAVTGGATTTGVNLSW